MTGRGGDAAIPQNPPEPRGSVPRSAGAEERQEALHARARALPSNADGRTRCALPCSTARAGVGARPPPDFWRSLARSMRLRSAPKDARTHPGRRSDPARGPKRLQRLAGAANSRCRVAPSPSPSAAPERGAGARLCRARPVDAVLVLSFRFVARVAESPNRRRKCPARTTARPTCGLSHHNRLEPLLGTAFRSRDRCAKNRPLWFRQSAAAVSGAVCSPTDFRPFPTFAPESLALVLAPAPSPSSRLRRSPASPPPLFAVILCVILLPAASARVRMACRRDAKPPVAALRLRAAILDPTRSSAPFAPSPTRQPPRPSRSAPHPTLPRAWSRQ